MGSSGGGKGGFAPRWPKQSGAAWHERPVVRDHLVQLRIQQMVLRHLTRLPPGQVARSGDGASASLLKLAMAQVVQEIGADAVEMVGHARRGVEARRPERRTLVRPAAQLALGLHSAGARTRSCATSSPSASSACRATKKATSCLATRRRPKAGTRGPLSRRTTGAPAGLRVVEIGQYVAAPLAATIFADLGARGDEDRAARRRSAACRCPPASPHGTVARRSWSSTCAPTQAAPRHCIDASTRPTSSSRTCGPAPSSGRWASIPDAACRRRARASSPAPSARGAVAARRATIPGWEPLVHARAGAQQGLFTGDDADLAALPHGERRRRAPRGARRRRRAGQARSPPGTASTSRRRCSTGCSSSTRRRSFTARDTGPRSCGNEVADPARVRHGRRPRRHGQPERHRALARTVPAARASTTAASTTRSPEGLARLSDREWNRAKLAEIIDAFATQVGRRVGGRPAGPAGRGGQVQHAGGMARATSRRAPTNSSSRPMTRCSDRSGWSARRCASASPTPGERGGPGAGTVGSRGHSAGHRIVDLSSFWAGPLAARLLAELGADVVKVEPPGGEGGFQVMPVLPNIYVDGNRSKRGLVLDLKDGGGPGPAARPRRRVRRRGRERHGRGRGNGSASTRQSLRAVNPRPGLRPGQGFRARGPAGRSCPSFDYVVQAATGMEMTQGGGRRPVPGQLHRQRLRHRAAAWRPASCSRSWAGPAGVAVTTVECLAGADLDRSSSPRMWRSSPSTASCPTRWVKTSGGRRSSGACTERPTGG